MTRTPTVLLAVTLLLASCTGDGYDGELDERTEAAVHQTLDDHLQAMAEGDWERVHDLTADEARPNDRAGWLDRRSDPDSTFEHKCLGDAGRSPTLDLRTVDHDQDVVVVESQLWEQSDMARLCRWRVIEEPIGWRVGDLVARQAPS